MYKIVNEKPKFLPMDIVKVLKTGDLGLITEVNLNKCQNEDNHQWSFCLEPLDKKANIKSAWYMMDELVVVNNLYEILTKRIKHPFSSSSFDFSLDDKRRN